MAVKYSNRAKSKFAVTLNPGDLAISVTPGDGNALFPTLTADDWFPLVCVKSSGAYEIMRCTARSGDILTVERAREGTSALTFVAGEVVELRMTKAGYDGLQAPISCSAGGTANAITLTPSELFIPEMMAGQVFIFTAASSNTGATTANIAGLCAIDVRKNASAALAANDIVAGQVYELYYNGTHLICTTASTAPNAVNVTTTINGNPVADYARLSQAQTFTAKQTIAATATATALELTSTDANGCILQIKGLATNGDAELELYSKGSGDVSIQAFRDTVVVGSLNFNSMDIVSIYGSGGQLLFQNDGAGGGSVFRTLAATGLFRFQNTAGADTLQLSIENGEAEIYTAEDDLYLRGGATTTLATTVSSLPELHYTVAATGIHYADGVDYAGTLYRCIHHRSGGVIDGVGTLAVLATRGIGFSVARLAGYATGGYRITLDSSSPISDFIVEVSIVKKLGASGGADRRIIHWQQNTTNSFDVTIANASTAALDDENFSFTVLW